MIELLAEEVDINNDLGELFTARAMSVAVELMLQELKRRKYEEEFDRNMMIGDSNLIPFRPRSD